MSRTAAAETQKKGPDPFGPGPFRERDGKSMMGVFPLSEIGVTERFKRLPQVFHRIQIRGLLCLHRPDQQFMQQGQFPIVFLLVFGILARHGFDPLRHEILGHDMLEFRGVIVLVGHPAYDLIVIRLFGLTELHNLVDYPFAAEYDKVSSFLADNGISYIDLTSSFAGYEDAEGLWVAPDDAHPNALAHKMVAEYSLEFIEQESADE